MLPILRLTADGSDHTLADGVEAIAKEFKVTDEERNQLLPSGRRRLILSFEGAASSESPSAGRLFSRRSQPASTWPS
jgi:restriction system protein